MCSRYRPKSWINRPPGISPSWGRMGFDDAAKPHYERSSDAEENGCGTNDCSFRGL
jgi:hypothetical protein